MFSSAAGQRAGISCQYLTKKSLISCDNVPIRGENSPDGVQIDAPMSDSFRFRRKEHLKGRSEVREVFGNGRQFSCRGAKLFVLRNKLPHNRICFTFTRGYGNAVARNRARRLGREAYRLIQPRLSGGHDLILLVYPETDMALFDRTKQLKTLFTKAGLLI